MGKGVLAVTSIVLVFCARPALAGDNDLALLNLCPLGTPAPGTLNSNVSECTWVRRDANGAITSVTPDVAAETRFRTLMSELGVVMAPQLVTPADTLGFGGFQVSAELGVTQISAKEDHWDGVRSVVPDNRGIGRPGDFLTTLGAYVRKGIWLPVPSMEIGAGALHLLDSQMVAFQGYAKLALLEGFHTWPLPSLSGRLAISHLTGSDQVNMDVMSFDLTISKAKGILGTSRIEPFGGWSYLVIKARAQSIDATPRCDAFAATGPQCAPAQAGTNNDTLAFIELSEQDAIIRHRLFAGFKLKFAAVYMTLEYSFFPEGQSRDGRKANGATDASRDQHRASLSAGFDF
jgi:hypothetical protein